MLLGLFFFPFFFLFSLSFRFFISLFIVEAVIIIFFPFFPHFTGGGFNSRPVLSEVIRHMYHKLIAPLEVSTILNGTTMLIMCMQAYSVLV